MELEHLSILVSVITLLALFWCFHNVFEICSYQSSIKTSSNGFHGIGLDLNQISNSLVLWCLSSSDFELPTMNLMRQKMLGIYQSYHYSLLMCSKRSLFLGCMYS